MMIKSISAVLLCQNFLLISGKCFEYNLTLCSNSLSSGKAIAGQGNGPLLVWAENISTFNMAIQSTVYDYSQALQINKYSKTCFNSYMNFTCALYFPLCDKQSGNIVATTGSPLPMCPIVCQKSYDACYSLFSLAGRAAELTTCKTGTNMRATSKNFKYNSNQPCFNTSNIIHQNNTSSGGSSSCVCPSPLVRSPFSNAISVTRYNCPYSDSCGYCCIPCPSYYIFYPEGTVPTVELTVGVVDMISFVFLLLVMLIFITDPTLHKDPRIMTLLYSVVHLICMLFIDGIFILAYRPQYMCTSTIDSNTGGACTAESFLYSFFGFVFAWSNIILDLNVMSALFHRDMFSKPFLFCCFAILDSVGLAIIIAAYVQPVLYSYGIHCSTESLQTYRKLVIYPIVVGLIINVVTATINNTTTVLLAIKVI